MNMILFERLGVLEDHGLSLNKTEITSSFTVYRNDLLFKPVSCVIKDSLVQISLKNPRRSREAWKGREAATQHRTPCRELGQGCPQAHPQVSIP